MENVNNVPEKGTVLREWYDKGVARKASHMLNVCDLSTIDNFPVYVIKAEDLENVRQQYMTENNMVVESVHQLVEIM